jgi:hypothetical protein
MSTENRINNQQIIVIGLIVIAALLAAIVGVMIYQQTRAIPTTTAGTTQTQTQTPQTNTPAMGGGTSAPVAFDPKTATKVAAGMTPEQHLKTYNEDIIKGKFAEAYKMLPLDKQQSYGSAAAYETQVKGYSINKYTMGKPVTKDNGNTVEIVTEQVTPQMPIAYTWTFKKVGGTWYVASRTMGGAVQ